MLPTEGTALSETVKMLKCLMLIKIDQIDPPTQFYPTFSLAVETRKETFLF